ncbi:DUF6503 family protein [Mesonia sp. MT50]|uniref:DUF6503 family protein n=1 Tax=Mesonia profundi TaxID=3070998 RepID=A0ABU0ZYA3_9FLAO|nr:DUF6503 family protein [Mesonia profundi]MDQ7916443.1 DUF6503 family protein [Mesonia profundi]
MKQIYIFLLLTVLVSCKDESKEPAVEVKDDFTEEKVAKAQEVLSKVIERAGGEKYQTSAIEFRFRGNKYSSVRNCGMYELQKVQVTEDGDTIKDVLSNMGFERFVNREKLNLPDSLVAKYSNAVNSVHYFAQLPFGLNDPAVKKTYLDTLSLEQNKYHKIKVQFAEEGGGDDHDDVYMYWVNMDKNTIDYLAYSFEVNGGGMRFRKAINPKKVNGIRFADYENYAPKEDNINVEDLDKAFMNDQLKKVSEIINEDIKVVVGKDKCN